VPALGVVLVHRDRPEVLAGTVAAWSAQGPALAITVVDNSEDPAVTEQLRDLLSPDVCVLASGTNAGFGPGANAGLRRWLAAGDGEWVAVAPHDARPEPGCLERLLAEAGARADAGLVCAEFGPGFCLVPAFDWVIGGYHRPAERGTGWQDVDYPHGTLMLARRAMLEEVGLFDERYFAYCEEVDLARRARAAGWAVGMVWGAVVRNGSLPPQLIADYLQERNTLLLVRDGGRWPTFVRAVLGAVGAAGRARRDRARAGVHLRLQAHATADFLSRRFGPPPPAVWALVAGRDRPAVSAEEWSR
jgi:cellulose synthase/poly-beta-1,6-N-acetylglucosamine synthase-like glycosyltransferase